MPYTSYWFKHKPTKRSKNKPKRPPPADVLERRKLQAYLNKRDSDEECMKNVKFTPNK